MPAGNTPFPRAPAQEAVEHLLTKDHQGAVEWWYATSENEHNKDDGWWRNIHDDNNDSEDGGHKAAISSPPKILVTLLWLHASHFWKDRSISFY